MRRQRIAAAGRLTDNSGSVPHTLDQAPWPFYEVDRGGKLRATNAAFDALGPSPAQFAEAHARVLRAEESVSGQEWINTPGGRRHVFAVRYPTRDAHGTIDGVAAILLPAGTALGQRDSDDRPRRVVRDCMVAESNMLPIIFWDLTGNITEANDAFLEMVGYTRDDLEAGRIRWTELTPPEYADVEKRALAEIARRGVCTPFEKEYIRKDGSRVPILIGGALPPGASEGVCFMIDVTASKRLEAQLGQLQRMETIGRVAAGVAHDFGTLVSAIRLHARALLKTLPDGDASRTDAERIVATSEHAEGLARQLMTYGRGGMRAPRP
jgi:PAS domain S-box-containing protein